MHKPPLLTSNFAHLQEHDEQLLRLGMLAERYFPDDPNTALLKLRQLATKSGIWFCDLRRPDNLGHALDGWYTPEGLTALLKLDEGRAHAQLKREPFAYGFALRHYQQAAIQAAEAAIARGQRDMLLAMATGTGKTKPCIALIYRLLKAQRFRRVLFLVDRSALGEQAVNAFKDTRMESLQTFSQIFEIKELGERDVDSDTKVHI